jgi:hypothetical protein
MALDLAGTADTAKPAAQTDAEYAKVGESQGNHLCRYGVDKCASVTQYLCVQKDANYKLDTRHSDFGARCLLLYSRSEMHQKIGILGFSTRAEVGHLDDSAIQGQTTSSTSTTTTKARTPDLSILLMPACWMSHTDG